jgi:uncharacterized protein
VRFPIKILLLSGLLLASCATYYQMNYEFNQSFESGDLEQAARVLEKNKKAAEGKARFLYFLNQGIVQSLLGNYEISNEAFEQAYIFGEDYRVNYLNEAASLLTNPTMTEYRGEDHEHLLLLYYKAINYLKLGDYESALVECRRLNIRLGTLSDKYKSPDKYKKDAFVNNLMGIIYEASGDVNNAFVAYRNAYETYEGDYKKLFGMTAPDQLKEDLLRTAYLNGFSDEVRRYEEAFGRKFTPSPKNGGELIFFWNNGLGPVKAEWSINFSVIHGQGGLVTFANSDYGFNFPFYLESNEEDKKQGLAALEFFRVAFPKYVERPVLFNSATLSANGKKYNLEAAEDVNAIAFKCLQERMLAEFGKSLLRVALKKAAEYQVRGENQDLGAAIGLFNALTEKADTRNWQTIPHTIYYSRVPLPEGEQKVQLNLASATGRKQQQEFTFDVRKGKTVFHVFQSLEDIPAANSYRTW